MTSATQRRLQGEAAIITGCGAGIGRASAELFARHGAKVACVDMDLDAATAVVAAIEAEGGTAVAIKANVRSPADIQAMVQTAIAAFGRITILFNNAGTGIRAKVHDMSLDDWNMILETNLTSVFLGCKTIIPHFLDHGGGKIVNTASSFGILASPAYPSYCATKAAIIMLTKQMALDYGPSIRVNCICPGATDTPRMRRGIAATPDPVARRKVLEQLNVSLNRLADPLEIANAALFLASDEASFCTGSALVVDGGQTIDA